MMVSSSLSSLSLSSSSKVQAGQWTHCQWLHQYQAHGGKFNFYWKKFWYRIETHFHPCANMPYLGWLTAGRSCISVFYPFAVHGCVPLWFRKGDLATSHITFSFILSGPEVGLNNPCRSLPNQDTQWFTDDCLIQKYYGFLPWSCSDTSIWLHEVLCELICQDWKCLCWF